MNKKSPNDISAVCRIIHEKLGIAVHRFKDQIDGFLLKADLEVDEAAAP